MKKINNQAVKVMKVVIVNKKTMTELTCVRMKTYSPKIVTLMIRWRLSQNELQREIRQKKFKKKIFCRKDRKISQISLKCTSRKITGYLIKMKLIFSTEEVVKRHTISNFGKLDKRYLQIKSFQNLITVCWTQTKTCMRILNSHLKFNLIHTTSNNKFKTKLTRSKISLFKLLVKQNKRKNSIWILVSPKKTVNCKNRLMNLLFLTMTIIFLAMMLKYQTRIVV